MKAPVNLFIAALLVPFMLSSAQRPRPPTPVLKEGTSAAAVFSLIFQDLK